MVAWTYAAAMNSTADAVYVASGDAEVQDVCASLEIPVLETQGLHESGTDRVAEAAASLSHDVVINLQADEPTIPPSTIDRLIHTVGQPGVDMGSLMYPISSAQVFQSPHRVKVVVTTEGRALYFSRAPIPAQREEEQLPTAYLHIGVYAFRRERLLEFSALERTPLEMTESLEQLRALENGWHIQMALTDWEPAPVDVIQDLDRASRCLAATHGLLA